MRLICVLLDIVYLVIEFTVWLKISATSTRSSPSPRSRGSEYDAVNRDRRDLGYDSRREDRGSKRSSTDSDDNYHREGSRDYDHAYKGEYGRKRSRYEGSRRTPGMQYISSFLFLFRFCKIHKTGEVAKTFYEYFLKLILESTLLYKASTPFNCQMKLSFFRNAYFAPAIFLFLKKLLATGFGPSILTIRQPTLML